MLKIDTNGSKKIEINIPTENGNLEKVILFVRNQSYEDVVLIKQFIGKYDLTNMDLGMYEAAAYGLMLRIAAWEGVYLKDDTPAPCSMDAKSIFFGTFPGAMNTMMVELKKFEEEEAKKSNPLQVG